MIKKDMRYKCLGLYDELWQQCYIKNTISQEEFLKWYNENCNRCIFMNEVCMDGFINQMENENMTIKDLAKLQIESDFEDIFFTHEEYKNIIFVYSGIKNGLFYGNEQLHSCFKLVGRRVGEDREVCFGEDCKIRLVEALYDKNGDIIIFVDKISNNIIWYKGSFIK